MWCLFCGKLLLFADCLCACECASGCGSYVVFGSCLLFLALWFVLALYSSTTLSIDMYVHKYAGRLDSEEHRPLPAINLTCLHQYSKSDDAFMRVPLTRVSNALLQPIPSIPVCIQ